MPTASKDTSTPQEIVRACYLELLEERATEAAREVEICNMNGWKHAAKNATKRFLRASHKLELFKRGFSVHVSKPRTNAEIIAYASPRLRMELAEKLAVKP